MNAKLRRQTLADLLHRSAKRFPDKTAIIWSSSSATRLRGRIGTKAKKAAINPSRYCTACCTSNEASADERTWSINCCPISSSCTLVMTGPPVDFAGTAARSRVTIFFNQAGSASGIMNCVAR